MQRYSDNHIYITCIMRLSVVVCVLSMWLLSGCAVALVGAGAGIGYLVVKSAKQAQEQTEKTLSESPPVHPEAARIKAIESRNLPPVSSTPNEKNPQPIQKYDDSPSEVRYIYPEGYFKEGSPR